MQYLVNIPEPVYLAVPFDLRCENGKYILQLLIDSEWCFQNDIIFPLAVVHDLQVWGFLWGVDAFFQF